MSNSIIISHEELEHYTKDGTGWPGIASMVAANFHKETGLPETAIIAPVLDVEAFSGWINTVYSAVDENNDRLAAVEAYRAIHSGCQYLESVNTPLPPAARPKWPVEALSLAHQVGDRLDYICLALINHAGEEIPALVQGIKALCPAANSHTLTEYLWAREPLHPSIARQLRQSFALILNEKSTFFPVLPSGAYAVN